MVKPALDQYSHSGQNRKGKTSQTGDCHLSAPVSAVRHNAALPNPPKAMRLPLDVSLPC